MVRTSPTQRTLRAMREQGRICAVAERNVVIPGMPYPLKQDLFGIIDLIVLDPAHGITGIQSCGQDFSGHMTKMTKSTDIVRGTDMSRPELCLEWMKAGGRLELWGWRKVKKKRGGKLMIWSPRVHVFTEEDF